MTRTFSSRIKLAEKKISIIYHEDYFYQWDITAAQLSQERVAAAKNSLKCHKKTHKFAVKKINWQSRLLKNEQRWPGLANLFTSETGQTSMRHLMNLVSGRRDYKPEIRFLSAKWSLQNRKDSIRYKLSSSDYSWRTSLLGWTIIWNKLNK